ncbi:diacylglycerol kinase family protein [Desertivirga xinjiangensis]|uniref:diacylglycerol kinase family protein n=1 Tax=Desertivirga xinjiangensis TaxID=539206 RepID=UPI00210EB708|nr:diacylglycerol kinase family protein [Pedobacter xinjiangensis]
MHKLKKFLKGFKYASQGVRYAFSTQINFKVHSALSVLVVLLGFFLNLSQSEWLWILCAICLVIVAELFNTALEVLVDLVSPDYHSKAGRIKDLASAAVLLTAVFAFITGLIIFTPKLFFFLGI